VSSGVEIPLNPKFNPAIGPAMGMSSVALRDLYGDEEARAVRGARAPSEDETDANEPQHGDESAEIDRADVSAGVGGRRI